MARAHHRTAPPMFRLRIRFFEPLAKSTADAINRGARLLRAPPHDFNFATTSTIDGFRNDRPWPKGAVRKSSPGCPVIRP
jgi:hypothetical protein